MVKLTSSFVKVHQPEPGDTLIEPSSSIGVKKRSTTKELPKVTVDVDAINKSVKARMEKTLEQYIGPAVKHL